MALETKELTADQIQEIKAYYDKEIADVQEKLEHVDILDMSEENIMSEMRLKGQLASLAYSKASFLADIERREAKASKR